MTLRDAAGSDPVLLRRERLPALSDEVAGFEVIRLPAYWRVPDLKDASVRNVLDLMHPQRYRPLLGRGRGEGASEHPRNDRRHA